MVEALVLLLKETLKKDFVKEKAKP